MLNCTSKKSKTRTPNVILFYFQYFRPQKPGDKGWVGRARVPLPSNKGYVVRPKWNTEQEYHKKGSTKKTLNRYEKHLRKQKQEKMQSGSSHAIPISVEGRHMPL